MTSLKTKNIWFLAAFVFLSIVPTLARVVPQGTWPTQGCHEFLRPQGHPPDIQNVVPQNIWAYGNIQNPYRYRIICQTYENVPRFLTLYDINNKIPVFSAYEYRRRQEPDAVRPPWMTEPQLENGADPNDINMRLGGHDIYINQAVNGDYDGHGHQFHKGHLFPFNHGSTQDDQISTTTLTNAVPQVANFNTGRWRVMEGNIRDIMNEHINNQRCFVVVGAIPGNNNLNNRVNIPARMWSAFFCTDQQGQNIQSGAYWDDNIVRDPPVPPMVRRTLQQLETTHHIVAFP